MSRLEARRWIKNNKNDHAFAGNRFQDNAEALRFVEELYENGAVEVVVDNIFKERWRIKENGGPYADTLIVLLPRDEAQREKLIGIFQEDNDLEPKFKEEVINKLEDVVLFWWD
jgi:hypothetical protein